MMGLAFASAVDLAAGLRFLERTIPLLIRNAPFALAFERGRGGVVYEAPATDVRHGVDSMLAAILHLARSCTAHRIVPTAVAASVRTLPRRLAAHGQTYPAMRRRAVVDGWLGSEMPMMEVAKRAGYGSRSSFERAFVQWRGETPAAVRARLRATSDE